MRPFRQQHVAELVRNCRGQEAMQTNGVVLSVSLNASPEHVPARSPLAWLRRRHPECKRQLVLARLPRRHFDGALLARWRLRKPYDFDAYQFVEPGHFGLRPIRKVDRHDAVIH
jgi:hypothetical protein